MAQVIQSLEEIETSYCVFEKDQVLTEGQLNGVSRYFDDQTRLTRVDLIGVGIVGPGAGELIAEGALAVENALLGEDVAATIHAHPTLAEGFMEAAESLLG